MRGELSVPEGGSPLMYLLLAGITCFGVMFYSRRETAMGRFGLNTSPRLCTGGRLEFDSPGERFLLASALRSVWLQLINYTGRATPWKSLRWERSRPSFCQPRKGFSSS